MLLLLDVHIYQPQHVHRHQNEGVANCAAGVEARADGDADDGHGPESGRSRQALDLVVLRDKNGTGAEEAESCNNGGGHMHQVR